MVDWQIADPFVVRMTGFPINHLLTLRFDRTVACIEQILACEAEISGLRQQLLTEHFATAVSLARREENGRILLSLFSNWRRAVGRQARIKLEPLPPTYAQFYALLQRWNPLISKHAAFIAKGQETWEIELAQARKNLWQIGADPLVQEAIFLSSPGMYYALQRHLKSGSVKKRKSAIRKFERRLVSYLQRLCTKNETQSFFGPINYGRLEAGSPHNLQLTQSEEPLRKRVVFPSFWMVEAIAATIEAEPDFQPYLAPRRSPLCRLVNNTLVFPASGKTQSLTPAAVALFQSCDGSHTPGELAARVGAELTEVMQDLERLQRSGAIVVRLIIPSTISDPLAYLCDWLAEVPDTLPARQSWLEQLREVQNTIAAFTVADLPQRTQLLTTLEKQFADITRKTARREGGKMYADRLLVFEECLGQLEDCTVGADLARLVKQQLKPFLRLWHAYGRFLNHRDQQAALAVWQTASANDAASVPFLNYLKTLSAHKTQPPEIEPLNQFMARFKELVEMHQDGRRACLQSTDLPALPLLGEADSCDCCSIDLMIAAENLEALQQGQFQLVLGEGHPQPLPWVFPTAYFWEGDDLSVAGPLMDGLMAQPGADLAAQLAFSRKSKIYPYQLPGSVIEIRPRYPDCRAIPVAEVEVRPKEGDALRLWANGQWLRLYPPLTRQAGGVDPLAPFAFTAVEPLQISLGEHTPRIEIDNIVYQREKWVVPTQALQTWPERGFELFLQVWRWKTEAGIPDEAFIRTPSEPKPVYVDFCSYLFVELFYYLVRQGDALTITEMLPNRHQLWLKTDAGSHCCELRMLAIAEGGD